jgi:hypothetical protein
LAAQRVEAGKLKLERARLELGRVKGELIETKEAKRIFGDQTVYARQHLLHLPGAVKTTLGLSMAQTLGLQKEMRAALVDLAKGKKAAGDPNPKGPRGKSGKRRARGDSPVELLALMLRQDKWHTQIAMSAALQLRDS